MSKECLVSLADRAELFQQQCDTMFRDADGLLTCIHTDGRALVASDLDKHAYNRPPHAGRGTALAWWRYEMTNIFMGQYLGAQSARARCGDAAGIAAGRAMCEVVLNLYFDHTRHIAVGMFGKPILGDGGLSTYAQAGEMNHDQVLPILTGLCDFYPFCWPREQRRIEKMVVEVAMFFRRHQYRMETRGRIATQPEHAVHGNKPMLFMLLAHRFAPEAGFYDEYLRWFEMARHSPAVNATCMTWLHWQSATGRQHGDDEVYAQGIWNMYIDAVAQLARHDATRRDVFRTRLRQWWAESLPMIRDDGRVQWSMMVRPETRRWRPMQAGEIERGPYSCWWGAPVLFSGQWAATVPVSVFEHCPEMAEVLRPVLLNVLRQTTENDLAFCMPDGPDGVVPANLKPGLITKLPPVMWLDAYWRAKATGLIE